MWSEDVVSSQTLLSCLREERVKEKKKKKRKKRGGRVWISQRLSAGGRPEGR